MARCGLPWIGALWVLLLVVFAEHDPTDRVQQLAPEGVELALAQIAVDGKPGKAPKTVMKVTKKSIAAAKAGVVESTKRLNAAKAAVTKATESMKTAHITKALSKTEMLAIKKRILAKSDGKSKEKAKKELAKQKAIRSKAKVKAVAKAMKKIVGKQMKKEAKKVKKSADKAAKKAGKALVKKAKAQRKAPPDAVHAAKQVYAKAKKEHEAARKHAIKTKTRAKKAGVDFKAKESAAKKVEKAVKAAKQKPVADDDKKPKPKLSALELAKIAAHDRKMAYNEHMASARAADREAAAARALHDAENQVSSLRQEVSKDKVAAKAQEGVKAAARFAKDQAEAKERFSIRGNTTKLADKMIVKKDKRTLDKTSAKVKKTLKDEKTSRQALAKLEKGKYLQKLRHTEAEAVRQLAKADMLARVATRTAQKSTEKAHKAETLKGAKDAQRKAIAAVRTKKAYEAHVEAKKQLELKAKAKKQAHHKLKQAQNAKEKKTKAKAKAKIAKEAAKMAKEKKKKVEKMGGKEKHAKSSEKAKKRKAQRALDKTKKDQLKEQTTKKAQKSEMKAKAAAQEKTLKVKAKMGAKLSEKTTKERNKKKTKQNEKRTKKLKKVATTAGGDPCDTCLKKCKKHYSCKTYCNAHWCGAGRMPDRKKELTEKLHVAKQEQKRAAIAMRSSKKRLDADIKAEKKARGAAGTAMKKATKTNKREDIKEAQQDERILQKVKQSVVRDHKALLDDVKRVKQLARQGRH